ncbi:hypothetical protein F8388_019416 [Cannabis sativa]|uniref:Uncharacterized protein n=1 Tax=Cannabis sativa TaxID=3483 RepID=A0A7J6FFZ9_CANSA|nr:hypothetical protein F8388_019416 [Cannabis sativa]
MRARHRSTRSSVKQVGQAAKISTPGPIISGFRIPALVLLGPLDEKAATAGAFLSPITVPSNKMEAVGEPSVLDLQHNSRELLVAREHQLKIPPLSQATIFPETTSLVSVLLSQKFDPLTLLDPP